MLDIQPYRSSPRSVENLPFGQGIGQCVPHLSRNYEAAESDRCLFLILVLVLVQSVGLLGLLHSYQ